MLYIASYIKYTSKLFYNPIIYIRKPIRLIIESFVRINGLEFNTVVSNSAGHVKYKG